MIGTLRFAYPHLNTNTRVERSLFNDGESRQQHCRCVIKEEQILESPPTASCVSYSQHNV